MQGTLNSAVLRIMPHVVISLFVCWDICTFNDFKFRVIIPL